MSEIIEALKVNLRYSKRFIPEHANVNEALTTPISTNEATAYDLIIHAITPMYQRAYADLNNIDNEEDLELPLNKDLNPRERIFQAYEQSLELFTEAREKFEKQMDEIVDEKYKISRSRQYATVGMHTIHHLGQAISICNINLRKLDMKTVN